MKNASRSVSSSLFLVEVAPKKFPPNLLHDAGVAAWVGRRPTDATGLWMRPHVFFVCYCLPRVVHTKPAPKTNTAALALLSFDPRTRVKTLSQPPGESLHPTSPHTACRCACLVLTSVLVGPKTGVPWPACMPLPRGVSRRASLSSPPAHRPAGASPPHVRLDASMTMK